MNPPHRMATTDDPRTARVIALFEALTPADLSRLSEFYAPDARFKDPFNEVQGVTGIRRVFEHMYEALDEPRFVVREAIVQGSQCFLVWDFMFRFKRFSSAGQCVRGGGGRLQRRGDCTATTGMRPRNCTKSCRAWARSCAGSSAGLASKAVQRWPSVSASTWKVPVLSTSQISRHTAPPAMRTGAGKGAARWMSDTTHGATS